jgi:hypothetical protein
MKEARGKKKKTKQVYKVVAKSCGFGVILKLRQCKVLSLLDRGSLDNSEMTNPACGVSQVYESNNSIVNGWRREVAGPYNNKGNLSFKRGRQSPRAPAKKMFSFILLSTTS